MSRRSLCALAVILLPGQLIAAELQAPTATQIASCLEFADGHKVYLVNCCLKSP